MTGRMLAIFAVVAELLAQAPLLLAEGAAETTPRYRLAWSTFLGGSQGEQAREVAVCADGSILVGGGSNSPDMPVTEGVIQREYGGEPAGQGHPGVSGGDCYFAHLSADGSRLLAATYLGGSRQERTVYGMALDAEGNLLIAGATRSSDFPTTPGAFRPSYSGSPPPTGHDGFAAKLSPDLTRLLWSTYLGGCWPRGGLALDARGNPCIVGNTDAVRFPVTTKNEGRPPGDNAFLMKVSNSGALLWTLLGGSGDDGLMGAVIDEAGNIYGTGHSTSKDLPASTAAAQTQPAGDSDAFVLKMSPGGSQVLWLTYLGGSANEFAEHRPCLTADGGLIVTGVTGSSDFPATPAAFQRQLKGQNDGYAAKYSRDGQLLWATLLGGSGGDFFLMPTPDAEGNIILVGQTSSPDLPVTADALQPHYGGGDSDGAFVVLTPDGSHVVYATYLGGRASDMIRGVSVGPDGSVYLVGSTASSDFPAMAGALQPALRGAGDMFVATLAKVPLPPATAASAEANGR